ncbi:MAG: DNA polymerase III subunit beta [Ruminococcaceae bacterium]|nr:DNA polymerase III subunit beta [Oscillospiraceae bacterium]
MKIVCNRQELLESLNGVSRAVSTKSSIPAIEGILLKCSNDTVILTAYDLEIGIVTSFVADVKEPGEIVLNSRLLIDMIRKMSSETVTIDADSELKAQITGGITKFSFVGIPASDFPEMPIPDAENTLTLKASVLKEMIGKTIFAVSTSDQKPVHTGTKFIMNNDSLTMVSVDGYRLAVCTQKVDFSNDNKSFIVPAKTLSEVTKLMGEGEEDVNIGIARRYGVFQLNNYTVITRLLEGDFLDYKKSIPEGFKTRVKIGVRELFDAVERASLIINDRFKSPIKFVFEDNRTVVTCATALGNAYDEIICDTEGDAVEMGFNNRYVLDALRNCGCDEVYLEIGGPISPLKMVPVQGNDFLFLLLPVRIKTAD